jgi:MFS family permease
MIAMVLVMPLTGFLGGFFGQKRVYLLSISCSSRHRRCAARRVR